MLTIAYKLVVCSPEGGESSTEIRWFFLLIVYLFGCLTFLKSEWDQASRSMYEWLIWKPFHLLFQTFSQAVTFPASTDVSQGVCAPVGF